MSADMAAALIENRAELLKASQEVFRKYSDLIPIMHTYLKQILDLGKNIDVYVSELDIPEQALWHSKYRYLFAPIFPAIQKYERYLGVLLKVLVLDQTKIYTSDQLTHLMVILIGEELLDEGIFSERLVEQISKLFLYCLSLIRDFFNRRELCLSVLSDSLTLDSRLLLASEHRGVSTFLIQYIAVDLMNEEHNWRAMYILARQERHVASLLHREEVAKRLEIFMNTLTEEMAENRAIKAELNVRNVKEAQAKKNLETAAKVAANLRATELAEELLMEESKEKTAAMSKAEKEKRKREEKAAKKAVEKAEAERLAVAKKEKEEANRLAKEESNRIAKEEAARRVTVKAPTVKAPTVKATTPKSLPSSISPASLTLSPPLAPSVVPVTAPSVSPPIFSNTPRIPTPSLAPTGFTPYSRPSPVVRFWETLDHRYIYQILNDIFMSTQNPSTRFYLKGSAAIHMYKRAHRMVVTNHTSDYDTTLLVNPALDTKQFYDLRSYMLNSIIQRLAFAMDDPRFNAEVITKLHGATIPFASSYWDVGRGETMYDIKETIPQEYIGVPDKSGPRFYADTMNQYPYASYAAKPSRNILNMRIIRTLVKPKNVTVLQLYTKTSPEIKLIEVTVPFYEYEENETQISLAAQWTAATQVNVIDGVPVLSLPALKAEQQKLRTLKAAAEIDRRLGNINALMNAAGISPKRRTRRLRK